MSEKNKPVMELNVEFQLLSERVKKIEEKSVISIGTAEKSKLEKIEGLFIPMMSKYNNLKDY